MSLINISKTENNFLEKKAVECGCTREEFIDLLITRDMESDCRYYECGSCTIQDEICETEAKGGWLNGSLCDVCIDHEGDLEILEKTRYESNEQGNSKHCGLETVKKGE